MANTKNKKYSAPLEGIKVVDFGWISVCPYAMKYLGDWGATVVRIESHAYVDILRLMAPYKDNIPGIDRSTWCAQNNSSKLGVSINLNHPLGKEIAWRLVKWADIMGSGYQPGVMKHWGFDYDSVIKVNPTIIYLCTSQMGQYGSCSLFPGWGNQSSAVAGFSDLIGSPQSEPQSPQGAHSDFICPPIEAGTIVAALDYRRRTGRGVYIDQAQLETGVNMLAPFIMDYQVNGRVLTRNMNRLPYAAPHGVYPCSGDDRWCAIAVFTDEEWQALCQIIRKKWTQDPKFATLSSRKANEDELDQLVAEWTATYTAEDIETMLQKLGVAAHVVSNAKDLFEDPQLRYRNHFRRLKHSVIGIHAYDFEGFRMSKTPDSQFGAPALGEHNEYVFKNILHMTDDEIANALVAGAITTDADLPEFHPWQ